MQTATYPLCRLGFLLAAMLVLATCAAAPPPAPARPVVRAPIEPEREPPASAPAAPVVPIAPKVEESDIGDRTGLKSPSEGFAGLPTPALGALDVAPTPAPEAVRPHDAEAPVPNAEPESLLTHIGPTTPPNVAAAMRLIEEGRQQLVQQHYDQALDRFERGVTIDPTNAYGYYFLAQLHYLMKKYDQAIAFAGRAVTLATRTDRMSLARAYSLQGAVFEEVGRYADARKAYQKAVEADPNNLAARVGVGRLGSNQ